ncbi:MAG: hypothetical protein FWG03_05525 [Clostridiales bacterium]|nr:hypothetical protein [Clostridiales bacterium]
MFPLFQIPERQLFIGNILIIACCGFYLAWWLVTFRTSGAAAGMKTGWLLIPAVIAGLAGVILAIRSMGLLERVPGRQLFSSGYVLWGGLAAYLILLAITVLLLKRPPTSELLLIVGWGVLALTEINALYGCGLFSHKLSAGLLVVICAALAVALVCYIIYYRLDGLAGYIDGMVPLLLTIIVMAAIVCFMAAPGK